MGASTDSQRAVPRWAFAVSGVLVAAFLLASLIPEDPHPVRWRTPAEAAGGASDGRPLLYDFTADWCVPCQRLDREVLRNHEMAEVINQHYLPVRVVDRQQEEGRNPAEVDALKDRFQVRAFPTLIVAAADGTVLGRQEGYPGGLATKQFLLTTPAGPPPARTEGTPAQ